MLVGLKRISIAIGLLATTTSATSWAQGVAPSPNQATANAVAGALRLSPALAGSRIEIVSRDGVVTLSGFVTSPLQKSEAITRAQQVAGVTAVADQLRVVSDSRVRPAEYQMAFSGQPYGGGMIPGGGGMIPGGGGMISGGVMADGMMPGSVVPGGAPAVPEGPLPEGPAGTAPASIPHVPNYAWPSYAPYPNFSAVGYPTAYPWQAWPNIGPFYPYPEVPLDWRAVTLRWDDGIWWLDFKKHYTRPFFGPYVFGLWAY
jgi:hypothetical protein